MTRRQTTPLRRTAVVALLLALVAVLAGACSDLQGTEGKNWISGEGEVEVIPAAERGQVVEATGEDLDGNPLDLADYRGKVVVLNVYAAWCPPCRKEMPTVVELANGSDASQVQWLGVNIRDNVANAKAFGSSYGVDFPTFNDPSSSVLLALTDKVGPYSLPSTVVLDREGRLAALVLGEIPGARTMQDVIDDVVGEDGVATGTPTTSPTTSPTTDPTAGA